MPSFTTFVRKVATGVQKALPIAKRISQVASNIAAVAGPALAPVTGGTSQVIAQGVQAANRAIQAV